MKRSARCVFDTNAVVSAALFEHGNPGRAFYWALVHCEVLLSEEVVEEISGVLAREKFARYVTSEERDKFIERLIAEARLIEVTDRIAECRDPKDDKFLELAVSGDASYLIPGDEDLLVLDPFRRTRIFSPREFVESVVRTGS